MTKLTNTASSKSSFKQNLNDYLVLTKARLALLVVFTAISTYLLAVDSLVWADLFWLGIGGYALTGASSALNQVLEKDFDRKMDRTKNRPIAGGRMEVSEAVMAAGVMSLLGLLILASFNPLTAVLGAISLVSYAFVYTPMKRVSPAAVWIGAIPGALPMSIGWVAATGELGAEAIFLFSLQFIWQFPHFWAIAWVAYEDYAKANFFLLPTKEKDGRTKGTAAQCVLYATLLLAISFMPVYLNIAGYWAVAAMTICGGFYWAYAFNLYRKCTREAALKLMFSSFVYLPIVLIIMVLDKI